MCFKILQSKHFTQVLMFNKYLPVQIHKILLTELLVSQVFFLNKNTFFENFLSYKSNN